MLECKIQASQIWKGKIQILKFHSVKSNHPKF